MLVWYNHKYEEIISVLFRHVIYNNGRRLSFPLVYSEKRCLLLIKVNY